MTLSLILQEADLCWCQISSLHLTDISTESQRAQMHAEGERRYERLAYLDWNLGRKELAEALALLEKELELTASAGNPTAWDEFRLYCLQKESEVCGFEYGRIQLEHMYNEKALPWQAV